MKKFGSVLKNSSSRRLFLQNGMIAAGAATMGSGLLPRSLAAFERDDADHKPVKKGDIAILRFLQALETVEADLWLQYSELGGTQDNEVSGPGQGTPPTRRPLRYWTATCLNTFTTTRMTKSVTKHF
jgi:hypothetical protein